MTIGKKVILFEPWHLGDALIACAIAVQDPDRISLGCNPKWHAIIRAASEDIANLELLSVNSPYISKKKPKPWEFGEQVTNAVDSDVVSIRGDIRDYYVARKMFPNSVLRFNGWTGFLARRSKVLDFPFSMGWLPIRNRYRAWAATAGVAWDRVQSFYRPRFSLNARDPIVIHVGAQWRARQFPHVAQLVDALSAITAVKVVAGARDQLPDGIGEAEVFRLVDRELVEAFRTSSCIIANDSGPMHLAGLLRCPTVVLSRVSAIDEWQPPGVAVIQSTVAPKGYMPDDAYQSEKVIGGWPTVDEVLHLVYKMLSCRCAGETMAPSESWRGVRTT